MFKELINIKAGEFIPKVWIIQITKTKGEDYFACNLHSTDIFIILMRITQ